MNLRKMRAQESADEVLSARENGQSSARKKATDPEIEARIAALERQVAALLARKP